MDPLHAPNLELTNSSTHFSRGHRVTTPRTASLHHVQSPLQNTKHTIPENGLCFAPSVAAFCGHVDDDKIGVSYTTVQYNISTTPASDPADGPPARRCSPTTHHDAQPWFARPRNSEAKLDASGSSHLVFPKEHTYEQTEKSAPRGQDELLAPNFPSIHY